MATPIENILFYCPCVTLFATRLCDKNEIKTAEQLATYNRFAFRIGGESRTLRVKKERCMGPTTLNYMEECLRRVGMHFSPEGPQARGMTWPQYKIYGKDNTKKDLLTAMEELGGYAARDRISRQAKKNLAVKLEPYEEYNGQELFNAWSFVTSVFELKIINPYFKELVNEGKVKMIRIKKGTFYRIRI